MNPSSITGFTRSSTASNSRVKATGQGIGRRRFLKQCLASGAWLALPSILSGPHAQAAANEAVRIGIIGLGGLNVVGGVGGRGRQLIAQLRKNPKARIVALCDVDKSVLEHGVNDFKDHGQEVKPYHDIRQLLDSKDIDAVVVALPNHWHGLATVWACQAGKDVYTEKPFSQNIWEGRQMVEAARKYSRMVQVGTQNRSSNLLKQAFDQIHSGEIGSIRFAHALVYRPREGIQKAATPLTPPETVDYELWLGPAQRLPLMRTQLHYEWHWFWNTGNGELGNNGVHVIDICRWALNQQGAPTHAVSIGGRLAVDDHAETPNTQIAFLDYKPAPILCEVRNVSRGGSKTIGKFRNTDHGVIIDCEGGSLVGDANAATFYDKQGKKIKDVALKPNDPEAAHLDAFLEAVRTRNPGKLAAEALVGHQSALCCHLGNISHRLGATASPDAIKENIRSNAELADAFERCQQYLSENGVQLTPNSLTLGHSLRFDPDSEQFKGAEASRANALAHREYRAPFVVPTLG